MIRPRLIPALLVAAGLCAACADDGPVQTTSGRSDQPDTEESAPPDVEPAIADVKTAGPADVEVETVSASGTSTADAAGDEQFDGWHEFDVSIPIPASVAVVGDSLTESAVDEIEGALTRIGVPQVTVDGLERRRMAVSSRDLPSGIDAIGAITDSSLPDVWVIALGTNDVGAQVNADVFRSDAGAVLDALPDDAPVLWVNLYIRWGDDLASDANEILADIIARREGSAVIDWYTLGAGDGLVGSDGVHFTPAGERAFADAMADAVLALAMSELAADGQLPQRD